MSTKFTMSFFDHKTNVVPVEEPQVSLKQLAKWIKAEKGTTKDDLPLLKFARFSSQRNNDNVIAITGVELDYDGEQASFDEAVEIMTKIGIEALVYTTPSYTQEKPRWRVCCPTSREMPPRERDRLVGRLIGLFCICYIELAPESWVLSQAYFYGAVVPNGTDNPDHRVEVIEGTPIDLHDELDPSAASKPNGRANGQAHADGRPDAGISDVEAALKLIPNDDLDWSDWNRIGMAVFRTTAGSEEGSTAFDEWSAKSTSKYDAAETRKRWDHYHHSPPTRLGFGTLVMLAREAEPGWRPPSSNSSSSRHTERIDLEAPYTTAGKFRLLQFDADDLPTLHHHRGGFYAWNGGAYPEIENGEIRAAVYRFLAEDCVLAVKNKKTDKWAQLPVKPNTAMVNNVLDALRAVAILPAVTDAPAWLDGRMDPDARNIIACANGLLDLPTLELLPHTPAYFTHNALDFGFDRSSPAPVAWLDFLDQLWGNDTESIGALQEIFGYALGADTSQQKAFLIVGPKRSGKGTIARVLTRLLGADNAVAPTLAGLGTNFGLAPLIGKRVAIISDARLGGRADQAVIAERLLSITGEDGITIDRKYREAWTGRLGVRFLILTNELPRLADASGALVSRFIVLALRKSFYDREDPGLTDKLLSELPGILNWAIAGWQRFRKRGYFVQPKSAVELIDDLEALGSPVGASENFVRSRTASVKRSTRCSGYGVCGALRKDAISLVPSRPLRAISAP